MTPTPHCAVSKPLDIVADTVHGLFHVLKAVECTDADVSLAAMFGYATTLRSLTKGRASYTMEPRNFEVVPGSMQETILNRT